MEGKLNISALKREAPCIGVALIKNPYYVHKYNFILLFPVREEKQQPSTGLAKLVHETTSNYRDKLGNAIFSVDHAKCLCRSPWTSQNKVYIKLGIPVPAAIWNTSPKKRGCRQPAPALQRMSSAGVREAVELPCWGTSWILAAGLTPRD